MKREKLKERRKELFIWLAIIMIGMFILGVAVSQLVKVVGITLEKKPTPAINNSTNITLQKILAYETANFTIIDGNCLAYATYFNTTLSEKYPELDIRWIRHMDICNDLTLCDDYHTYLMIGGYNTLCMLNSKRYDCVDFPKEY